MNKRHLVLRRCQQPLRTPSTKSCTREKEVRYWECQKNHAANLGGYAVDGCREFMASGEEGTADAMNCAACGCHRSFHRREQDEEEDISECSPPTSSKQ